MKFDLDDVAVLYSPSMETFANSVSSYLTAKLEGSERSKFALGQIRADWFNSNEWDIQIMNNVRERHAYVIHAFTGENGRYSPNDGLMALYLIDNALRLSSAREITYILPHIPYQRKDHMDKPRVPISAKRTSQMIMDPAYPIPTRVVTFDMHSGQIQGFFPFPVDHLNASPLFVRYFKKQPQVEELVVAGVLRNGETYGNIKSSEDDFTVISPDAGGAQRARYMAKKLNNNEIALIDKRRPEPGMAEVMHVVGKENIAGKPCIMRDDIVDTAGTAIGGAYALTESGATAKYLCATHGILSQDRKKPERVTEEEIRKSGLKVVITDTIPRPQSYLDANKDWLTVLSVAPMVAESIYLIQTRGSISELID